MGLFKKALGLFGRGSINLLSPAEFTREFAEVLRASAEGLKVEVAKDLELKVTMADGGTSTSFLENAYDIYQQSPESKAEVINKYVSASLETIAHMQKPEALDPARIIPVVKDRHWLEDMRQAMLQHGAKEIPENIYEDLNADLIVLYAEDSPKNIRYLVSKDLEEAQLNKADLRKLACDNLKRLLPNIDRRGANGIYMLTAGGDYEASLLLLDSVWDDVQSAVHGEIVVAIPARDVLVATGSEDSENVRKLKQIAEQSFAQASYRLTQKLFVRRNGAFVEFS